MYRCRNDVACAELDTPVTIQDPRPLIWDDTPAKDLVNKPLVLVGLRTRGIATGYNFEVVKDIEAAIGGWRHLFEKTTYK